MNGGLISKAEAVQMLREKADGYTASMFGTSSECYVARVVATEIAAELQNMPAVDAVPVRHGHWKKDARGITRCTSCKGRLPYTEDMETYWGDIYQQEIDKTEYCPHCGATMGKKEV